MFELIGSQLRQAVLLLLEQARLQPKDILVVGCSTSEVLGHAIGSDSSPQAGQALFNHLYPLLRERDIFLAAQCCEHLNRCLIVEEEALGYHRLERVNAVPQPKAGGSFATAAYHGLLHPAAVERVTAQAGMDIGDTLIGMHLQQVAVPIRLNITRIGEAHLVCARTRPKFVGGIRARYDDRLG